MRLPPHAAVLGLLLAGGAAFPAQADDRSSARRGRPGAAAADGATIFRVFLTDGSSLVSYGEPARVGDRIVFSMPTAGIFENPPLHLVNLASGHVDWPRTERYAEAARAAKYYAGNAEADYSALTGQIAAALAAVAGTTDPAQRLAIVEKARRTLADWPRTHFNYRETEILPMLGMLDEIVAELRALAGAGQFDLTFVARSEAPVAREPLLPLPTPKETLEQVLAVARLSEIAGRAALPPVRRARRPRARCRAAAERLACRDADGSANDDGSRARDRAAVSAAHDTDPGARRGARQRSRRARSRAVEGRGRDERRASWVESGPTRSPASSFRSKPTWMRPGRCVLAHDRWELRKADYRDYGNQMTAPLARLERLQTLLDDIKSLVGSSPFALSAIQRGAGQATKAFSAIVPPEEFRSAHALFLSAAHLADTAAKIRMEAALTGDLRRAWDASSAAAGALMLEAQARTDFKTLFQRPQLPK